MSAKRDGWRISPWTAHLSSEPALRTDPDPAILADLRARSVAREGWTREDSEDYVKAYLDPVRHRAATVAPTVQGSRTYQGARVKDDALGVTYEVAAERVNGKPRIVILTVIPHDGTLMNARTPVPVAALARVALEQAEAETSSTWAQVERRLLRTMIPVERDIRPGDDHAPRRPPLAEIARIAIEAHNTGGSARRAIEAEYGIPLRTADGWLRAAREHGALSQDIRDGRGRKRQPQTKRIRRPRATEEAK